MGFTDTIGDLADKVREKKSGIATEEATKNAFVMPFVSNVLGYDVFDPNEVVPEFVADVGVKRGEKIDYAIFVGGKPQLLIECKTVGDPLNLEHASQLFRYFSATSARIAILTNGQQYHVYSDLDAPNRMDDKPFLMFDLLDMDRKLVPELEKLAKDSFDLNHVLNAAEELKYVGQIKRILASEFQDPSDNWIKHFVDQVYQGRATPKVRSEFRDIVMSASSQYINDQVNNRLTSALGDGSSGVSSPASSEESPEQQPEESEAPSSDIVTTEEELEGFTIVRAIAVSEISPERVVHRDAKSYFAVLLDDNNRKPIIRLHLNAKSVKYVTTFEDEARNGVRHDIDSVVDIYKFADQIRSTVRQHVNG